MAARSTCSRGSSSSPPSSPPSSSALSGLRPRPPGPRPTLPPPRYPPPPVLLPPDKFFHLRLNLDFLLDAKRTYSDPRKKMHGKGCSTIQFGCATTTPPAEAAILRALLRRPAPAAHLRHGPRHGHLVLRRVLPRSCVLTARSGGRASQVNLLFQIFSFDGKTSFCSCIAVLCWRNTHKYAFRTRSNFKVPSALGFCNHNHEKLQPLLWSAVLFSVFTFDRGSRVAR
jgi:hypothetical protein